VKAGAGAEEAEVEVRGNVVERWWPVKAAAEAEEEMKVRAGETVTEHTPE